jgi:hypothetical protein
MATTSKAVIEASLVLSEVLASFVNLYHLDR